MHSDFSCRIYFNRHKYDSSDRETTFRVRFDWEWEERPATALTDIIGAIVSEDMYWDDDLSYHKVNYYHYSGSDDYVEVFDFEPTDEIHAMQQTFEMLDGNYYALDGRAYCGFTRSGRVPEAAMIVRYGHSIISCNPSVSVGSGSLGIDITPERRCKTINDRYYYIHSTNYGDDVTIE